MIIDCISDLHGSFPELQGGDLLIVAGDLTSHDLGCQYERFLHWVEEQDYYKIIVIAGNHDGLIEEGRWEIAPPDNITYLQDSGIQWEGKNIWGSPWTPRFSDWHFMKKKNELKVVWDLIPQDTDILITHGPPHGIMDQAMDWEIGKMVHCGCEELDLAVKRIKPQLHVFGHIHGGHGTYSTESTTFVNAAIMDEGYKPVNKPIRIEL